METKAESNTKTLTITRTFNAPRQLVWEAWANVKHIQQWWAPKGFTNPVCNWDFKAGGKIYIEMKAPDGVLYPMEGEFLEIVKPERIIFTSPAIDKKGEHLFEVHNTVTFTEEGNKTKVELHIVFSSIKPEGLQSIGGAEMGWNTSFDKLVTLLNNLK